MDGNVANEVTGKEVANVQEMLENAKLYTDQLNLLLATLNKTYNKLLTSAEKTKSEIETIFSSLKTSVLNAIDERKSELLLQLQNIETDALSPLEDCRDMIKMKVQLSEDVIKAGQKIINNKDKILQSALTKLGNASSDIGSLPEVPKPTDVPCISLHVKQPVIHQLVASIQRLGRIAYLGPIQILESKEKPGALAIQWEETDVENQSGFEGVKFQLQCCPGNVDDDSFSGEYYDVYVGPETCYIVRNLKPNVDYTFRVCQFGAEDKDWSLPYVARTTITPYEWDLSNQNYFLSDECRIATKITSRPNSPLYSAGPQFQYRHSLQFKVLECGVSSEDEGLGLALTNTKNGESIVRPGVILVNFGGYVFVDGIQMTTRLPSLFPGAVISFESEEELPNSKMRVMVTCEDKQVTYDWRVDDGSGQWPNLMGIYFFMCFRDPGWKVMVE